MKYTTVVPLLALTCTVSVSGQTKKTNKSSSKVETTRVWHRHVSKDEVDGDRVAFYLPSVEDEKVLLIVVCPDGRAGFASLNFPFTLYGVTQSTLKYKSATGDVKEFDLGLTDGKDAMVASRADVFKPLVGGTFREKTRPQIFGRTTCLPLELRHLMRDARSRANEDRHREHALARSESCRRPNENPFAGRRQKPIQQAAHIGP
jgi:hypothetical protein